MINFKSTDYTEVLRLITDSICKNQINVSRIIRLARMLDTSYTDDDWLAKDIRYWSLLHGILDRFSGKPWSTYPDVYAMLMVTDIVTVLTTQQQAAERSMYITHRNQVFAKYGISSVILENNSLNERKFILKLLQAGMVKDIISVTKVLAQLHHIFNVREDPKGLDLTYSKLGILSGANNTVIGAV